MYYQQCEKCGCIYEATMPVIPHAFCIEPGCGSIAPFNEFKQIELELEFKKKKIYGRKQRKRVMR